ncbi:MAG: hypothetical protein ACLP50_11415 [Solirubrobacteraceae bacterium]
MAGVQPRASRTDASALTERDLILLAFVAEHRFVIPGHVAGLLRTSPRAASTRLRALVRAGHLRSDDAVRHEPTFYQITRAGLKAVGSDLPAPRDVDIGTRRHDIGLAWLMLAARAGRFGPLRDLISERRMRSHDGRAEGRGSPFGVRLGGTGPRGTPRLHHPDLIAVTAAGRRVAFELELSSKPRGRREGILAGYAADRRIAAVVYLVDIPAVGRAITRSAARLEIAELISVQRVAWGDQGTTATAGRGVLHARGSCAAAGHRAGEGAAGPRERSR